MNLVINEEYKYIAQLDVNDEPLNGLKPIIYSAEVSNELISMMFAKNLNDNKTTAEQMLYGPLTDEEVSLISVVGTFQLTNKDYLNKYEYYTLLNSINLTGVLISENCMTIHMQNEPNYNYYSGINLDISNLRTSKKLLLITKSSDPVNTLSQEIHNMMLDPHYNINNYVLFEKDLNSYLSTSVIDLDYFDRQAQVKLGNLLQPFGNTGNTEYIQGIWDEIGNRYLLVLNEIPKVV